ncbi:FAD-dependent oxidoreductase [Carboxydochorda subterranea]|uniref:FAD-dependent oxidoreductase n=1 Tax=Carboxydichorda subterranea TaxID=3109565 RepID=A0ABZ1BZC4_9FIRM|nr:FAD-dependent oxidoreductase [Limnochorda sp. L945t]WRP18174.1 FAD-dependent oxidoreductase [Limnochorda sp. L945t]
MASRRLVVVGGVAAGMSAASRARRVDPQLEIVVFERSGYVSYGSCGIPYFVGGLVERLEDLVVYTPQFFREKRRIDVHVSHEVTAIDPRSHRVQVRRLSDGETWEAGYDVLVLATGAYAVRPPVPGVERPGVFVMRLLEDGMAMRRRVEELKAPAADAGRPPRAVVVGAGPIGLEAAENLRRLGCEVAIVEVMPQVLPGYHPELARIVEQELRRNGVEVYTGEPVAGIEGQGEAGPATAVSTPSRTLPADLVLVATGVRPQVALARAAGIALGATGAVAVDDHLRTSVPDIFAAGDGVEAWHRVLERPVWIPLGTTSNKQGRIAGENAAGGDARFRGIVGTAALRVFDLEVARTGLTREEAEREPRWEAVEVHVRHGSRAHYYPGRGPIDAWLVGDRKSGRLLGAQMVGPAGSVAKRIDVLAVALSAGLPVEEVAELDLSYAPPFAPVWDVALIAAREWLKDAALGSVPHAG